MPLSPEEELKRKEIQGQIEDHYRKIFEGVFKWCLYEQPPHIDAIMVAFKVDRSEIALRTCEEVLTKYKEGVLNESESKQDLQTQG